MPDDNSNERTRADANYIAPLSEPSETCGLKKLPAEIRNEIFWLAVVEPEPIKLGIPAIDHHRAIKLIQDRSSHRDYQSRLPFKGRLTGPALASTCRQFHQEVTAVFFTENTFTLGRVSRKMTGIKHSPFPLARMTKLIIQATFPEKPSHIVDAGLHVIRLADETLAIKMCGASINTCMCKLEEFARSFSGDGCMTKFVDEFLWADVWDIVREKVSAEEPSEGTCEVCGEACGGADDM